MSEIINKNFMLKDLLNWPVIMKQPRTAGGHTEILDYLFTNCAVLAKATTGGYQGEIGYVYLVYAGQEFAKIVVISDYYGSCNGCDSWEDACDESVKEMCTQLANNAHMFDTVDEAIKFLRDQVPEDEGAHWDLHNLSASLVIELEETRKKIKAGDYSMFVDDHALRHVV